MGRGRVMGRGSAESKLRGMGRGMVERHGQGQCRGKVSGAWAGAVLGQG